MPLISSGVGDIIAFQIEGVMTMAKFDGFPAGPLQVTPLPNAFFTQVLPELEDPAEIKVLLHLFWLLHQAGRRRRAPAVSRSALLADATLARSLDQLGGDRQALLDRGITAGLERGTILAFQTVTLSQPETWYCLNNAAGRRTLDDVTAGRLVLPAASILVPPPPPGARPRPDIYTLYEREIGLLTPLIVEELKEAEALFPADWIVDAFAEAGRRGKRRWRYVRAILDRWGSEGRRA